MIVGDWAPVVGVSAIALSCGAAVVLRGPIGNALAQWIGSWSRNEAKWMEVKMHEAGGGRAGERLAFPERMLARSREAERLPPVR
ncbi:MAG TPA: hypothetical protein VIW26_05020 [Gemmatimonadales bacterium]|jgi:hypothetical protein